MSQPILAVPSLVQYKDLTLRRAALENDRFEDVRIRPVANYVLAFDSDGTLVPTDITTIPGLVTAPALATSAGVAGQMAYAGGYVYVCIATNVWRRSALTTF